MNRKRETDELEKLTALDDDSVEEIAEVCPFLDESHKNKLYTLCEKKLNTYKNEKRNVCPENYDTEYILKKGKKNSHFGRLFVALAASFALIVGVTALTISGKNLYDTRNVKFDVLGKCNTDNSIKSESYIACDEAQGDNEDVNSKYLVSNGFNIYDYPEYLAFLQGIPNDKNFYKYIAADSYGVINFSLKDLNNDRVPELLIYSDNILIGIYVDTEDSTEAEPLFDMDDSTHLNLCEFDAICFKSSDEPITEVYYEYIGGKELKVIYGMQSFYYKTFNSGELYEDGAEYAYYAVTEDRLPDEGHGWDGERYSFPDEKYRMSESDFENTQNTFSEVPIKYIATIPLYKVLGMNAEIENITE